MKDLVDEFNQTRFKTNYCSVCGAEGAYRDDLDSCGECASSAVGGARGPDELLSDFVSFARKRNFQKELEKLYEKKI